MFTSFYDKNDQEVDQSNSIRKSNKPTNPTSFFDTDEEMFSIKTNSPRNLIKEYTKITPHIPEDPTWKSPFSDEAKAIHHRVNLTKKNQGQSQSQYSMQRNDFNNNNGLPSSYGVGPSVDPSRSSKNMESLFKKYKEATASDEISSNLNDNSPTVSTFVPNKRLESSLLELETMYQSYLDLYSESRDKLNAMQDTHIWLRSQMLAQDVVLLPKTKDYSDAKPAKDDPETFEEIECDFLQKMNLMISTHNEIMINFNALNIEFEENEDFI